MPITEDDVKKIAALAHLEITDEELRRLAPQMASIVAYVEQLKELDTSSAEPLGQALALEQAPDPSHGHFRVPKVLASSEEAENF